MKRIVYLTFYFKPDLSACSFRNSSLVFELADQAKSRNIVIDLYTTQPNRYTSFNRINIPSHKNSMINQVASFVYFFFAVIRLNKGLKADLIFASSSKLFTAFLGYRIAKKTKAPLYLDIRDIFVDTINDIFKSQFSRTLILPLLKFVEFKTFNYAKHINLISGGFREYFQRFNNPTFSFFPNGVDDEFLTQNNTERCEIKKSTNNKKVIVYAGNLGEGQGLHKIIPQAAKLLGNKFEFLIFGDGGTRNLLLYEIKKHGLNNVIVKSPIKRKDLINFYNRADYLFLHLNDYPAFRKVLPSKIFELATFKKPILAGVSGFSAKFMKEEVDNCFVFNPCDIQSLVGYLLNNPTTSFVDRAEFVNKYRRSLINKKMSNSILNCI